MNSFIVFAHPEPKSFCGALADAARQELSRFGEVLFSDLYQMKWHAPSDRTNFLTTARPDYFKPQTEEIHANEHNGFAPDIEAELRKIEASDFMLWVFPLWWFSVPAILKGWVDRTFVMGRTYGMGRIYDTGVFKGKRAMLCLTTGGPESAYVRGGFNGDIEGILRPIHRGMLQFTGFEVLRPFLAYAPAHIDDSARAAVLSQWKTRLKSLGDESGYDVGTY
jgi:NAD(P)H dehydrogenase (quinone)